MTVKKLLFFVALFSVLFAGLALADSNLDINMSTTTLSGSHNSAVSGSFTLANLNASDSITGPSCALIGSSWTLSCSPSALSANQSSTVTFSVAVPQYTLPGTYDLTLNVTGKLSSANITAGDTQAFKITVASSASYGISWITAPSNIYQEQNQTVAFNITNTGNIALTTNVNLVLTNANSSLYNKSDQLIASKGSLYGTANIATNDETHMGKYTLTLSLAGTGTDKNIKSHTNQD